MFNSDVPMSFSTYFGTSRLVGQRVRSQSDRCPAGTGRGTTSQRVVPKADWRSQEIKYRSLVDLLRDGLARLMGRR